jgi:hypothetical protein
MPAALTLIAVLVTGAPARCYEVTNRRIVVLPTCDFSPETVASIARAPDGPEPTDAGVPLPPLHQDREPARQGRSARR